MTPTTKSPTIKTVSVANIVTPTTYGKDIEVVPDESPFEVGSIASINGRGFDGYRFKNRDSVPTCYGIVEETTLVDDIVWNDTKFACVSSGEYEWLYKRKPNMMTVVWSHSKFVTYAHPPRNLRQDEP